MAKTSAIARTDVIGPLGIVAPPEILIECEAFKGSLELLFRWVRDKKVNLLDIPLAPICLAYVEYLVSTEQTDLERAVVAANALAYLLERKVLLLLPDPDEENEEELEQVIEGIDPTINLYAPIMRTLEQKMADREMLYFRDAEGASAPYELPFDNLSVSGSDLARALERLLERAIPATIEPLGRPRRSLTEQMSIVLKALPEKPASLDVIVQGEFTRTEAVWWFLALLELIRLGQATVILEEGEPLFGRVLQA